MSTLKAEADELDTSPQTFQQMLDSFYGYGAVGVTPSLPFEAPDKVLPQVLEEKRPGLATESIDMEKHREFMRGL